ncbi:MAG TPA: tetratricopeptide repeat protein [Gaiellaceae bacterium]|nr:tetratricopeptide repeat protein [Gaiellaceae bacterium]
MPTVTIRLLAGFDAAVDGEPVAPRAWRLKKARELVKLLALAPGRRLHREQVMDALWRDHSPTAAANNLYQAVHAARRALGPDVIDVHDELVSLSPGVELDVDRFTKAADEAAHLASAAAVREALSLYPGELLPENRYDDWADEPRTRLGALQAELAALLHELGSGSRVGQLPIEASSFVGRGRELQELHGLLGRTRLLTLTGVGGAGKTRLALELARTAGAEYADGTVLVELAPVGESGTVPVAAAAALDVRALPGQDLSEAIRDFLAHRSVLLLLDNCEHLITASAELVDAILRTAGEVTIVATSREPLRVAGETVFRVPSLAIPDPEQRLAPAELLRYESVRLFAERAGRALPGFEVDDRNAGDVARICFRLDGLPLALELAAGRLGALSPAVIAERLDDRFRLLQGGNRAAPTRQQTLVATLQWSHDLLEPEEETLFRRLAVFSGGFRLDAAEAVCSDGGLDEAAVADILGRLVEKSLVAAGDVDGAWRYGLLDTVRAYAQDRLAEAGETAELARRHATWTLAFAERERESGAMDAEAANVRTALQTLLEHAPNDALRLCVAVYPFWLRRIDLGEGQRRFAAALAAAPERTALRAEALRAAGAIDMRSGTIGRGTARAEEAYSIAEELGDARAQWLALQFLGEFAIATDTGKEASRWAERGLAFARREGLTAYEALCVYTVGVARWIVGDLERADRLLAESLERFRAADPDEVVPSPVNVAETRAPAGDSWPRLLFEDTLQPFIDMTCAEAVGYVLANLATITRLRGDLDGAAAQLAESTAIFEALDDRRGEGFVLARRAFLALALGSFDEARRDLGRALEIRTELNDRRGIGLALTGLGMIDTRTGDYEHAEVRLTEARDIFRRAGDRWGLASTLWRLADLQQACGRLDEAWSALGEAKHVLAETARSRWLAFTDVSMAEVATARGERDDAKELWESALAHYRTANDLTEVARIEKHLQSLAKTAQSSRKGGVGRTQVKRSTKGRTS